jgi:hypothetical protein
VGYGPLIRAERSFPHFHDIRITHRSSPCGARPRLHYCGHCPRLVVSKRRSAHYERKVGLGQGRSTGINDSLIRQSS